jgi:hypothetical protein
MITTQVIIPFISGIIFNQDLLMTDLAAAEHNSGTSTEQPIYDLNGWWVFSGICFIYLFFNWWLQTQVLTDQFYYYSLGARVSADKLASIVSDQHKTGILSYVLVPVTLLFKMILVSFCLLTGLLLTSQKLPFQTLFKIVLFAESAFAASILLRLLLLSFSHNIESLAQFQSFAPLSLFSLFKASSVPAWLYYPLQTLDLFQAAYCLILAAGLRFFLQQPFGKMLRLVAVSYGLGLLSCMIVVAFLVISIQS